MNSEKSVHKIKIDTTLVYTDEEFKQVLQEIINSQNEISNIVSLINENIIDNIRTFVDLNQTYAENVSKNLVQCCNDISESIHAAVDSMVKSIPLEDVILRAKEIPNTIKESLLLMSEYGWYFDSDMELTVLWTVRRELENMNITEVDNFLIDYYKKKVLNIRDNIISKYPKRKKIIEKAFKAHQRKEYELSIPVFLAQIDGICNEKTGCYLFIRENKRPKTATYVLQNNFDEMKKAEMYPLTTIIPVLKNTSERETNFSELNRHLVLHGDSIDYANETNGYKAISLLNYVAQIFK